MKRIAIFSPRGASIRNIDQLTLVHSKAGRESSDLLLFVILDLPDGSLLGSVKCGHPSDLMKHDEIQAANPPLLIKDSHPRQPFDSIYLVA